MPTYDYQCEACGKIVEVFHAMSESGPEFCDCEKKGRMRRLLSAGSGLIFKGSGFYITDYARKNNGGESASSGSSTSASGSSSKSAESSASSDSSASSSESSSSSSSSSGGDSKGGDS